LFGFGKRQRKSVPITGATFMTSMPLASTMAADKYALEGYVQNAAIHACVKKIANAAASVDLYLQRKSKNGTLGDVIEPDLERILERPNQAQGWSRFMRVLVSNYLINGNAYVRPAFGTRRTPEYLYLMRPELVSPKVSPQGELLRYEYKNGNRTDKFEVVPGENMPILHLREFNPADDLLGLSTIAPAARSGDIMNTGLQWIHSLLKNSATPSGAIQVRKKDGGAADLSEEQYKRLKDMIDAQFAGASNAGRPLLLEGGLEWQSIGMDAKSMQYLESLWASARMIATAFGVPPQLINIPGDSTYNNMNEAKLSLWEETVLPLVDFILDEMNNWLTPMFDKTGMLKVCYDQDSIPALKDKRMQSYESLEKVSFLTIPEKRAAAGYSEEPEKGEILVPAGTVPLSFVEGGGDDN
jgi:HK97 family phage portal protein